VCLLVFIRLCCCCFADHNVLKGHNAIEKIEGLENLKDLNTLDFTSNRIASCAGLSTLSKLEELWMGYNLVATFDVSMRARRHVFVIHEVTVSVPSQTVAEIDPANVPLKTIYLEHNPIAKEFTYRTQLKKIHAGLTQIDATYVR